MKQMYIYMASCARRLILTPTNTKTSILNPNYNGNTAFTWMQDEVFSLICGAWICGILNSCQERWTGPCGARPRPAPLNPHVQTKERIDHDYRWHNFFFLPYPSSNFFYRSTTFHYLATLRYSGKEAPNLVDPLDWAIISHWAIYKQ